MLQAVKKKRQSVQKGCRQRVRAFALAMESLILQAEIRLVTTLKLYRYETTFPFSFISRLHDASTMERIHGRGTDCSNI